MYPKPIPEPDAQFNPPRPAPRGNVWAALLATLAAASAHAENWPVSVSGSQSFSHDSNLFRRENNVEGDTIASTGLTVGIDKSYGRQTYSGSISGNINRYSNNTQLNYDGYSANGSFFTSISTDATLSLTANKTRSMARFDAGADRRVERNIENDTSFGGSARYGLYSKMSLGLSGSHFEQNYTATSASYPHQRSGSYSTDLRYTPQPDLTFGVGLRHSPGHTFYDQTAGSSALELSTKTNNLDLTTSWQVSGLTSMDARLSYTKQKQVPVDSETTFVGQDFKGWTGALSWRYTPRGLLSYSAGLSRDTTNNASLNDYTSAGLGKLFGGVPTLINNQIALQQNSSTGDNRVTTALNAGVDWEATAKIRVGLSGNWSRLKTRSVVSTRSTDPSSNTELIAYTFSTQTGTLTTYNLNASYAVFRWLNLSCSWQRLNHTRDLYSLPYSANVIGCNAAATLNAQN